MLDKIQHQFNRINAACVRFKAKTKLPDDGHSEDLQGLLTDLELLADDAEQLDAATAADGTRKPAPAPVADPVPQT